MPSSIPAKLLVFVTFLKEIRGFVIQKGAKAHPGLCIQTSVANHKAVSSDDLIPGIDAILKSNDLMLGQLENLRENSFFRFYSVDILASCEYMPQELFECYTESCEIYPADEDEIPVQIQDVDKKQFDFDLDGWTRWDMPSDDYYDILAFPEGYTDYDGSEVWNFIHNRICFPEYGYDDADWKSNFNKAVSGLHSMISAQVSKGIQEKIDEGVGFEANEKFTDPKTEYVRRLSPSGETPQAMENLYFAYMMLISAVSRVSPRLIHDCDAGIIQSDVENEVKEMLSNPLFTNPAVFAAAHRFQSNTASISQKADLWQARMRSRELMRIMNCVQCNKCRLHGKISILGLTTAIRVHIDDDTTPETLKRVEVAALVTTLHKFSRSLNFCETITTGT